MKNPWTKKNPFMSMWLSGANAVAGSVRGHATAAAKRETATAVVRQQAGRRFLDERTHAAETGKKEEAPLGGALLRSGALRCVQARSSTAISRTITSSIDRLAPPVARRSANKRA